MKIYKLSLGKQHFNETDYQFLKAKNLVCVHPDTGKGEGPAFVNSKKGDIFYVCHSNESIEFIGMFTDNMPFLSTLEEKNNDGWLDREYLVLFEAKNKTAYNKDYNTKIMPRFQSTFTLISNNDLELLENEILKPVFNISKEILFKKHQNELTAISKDINYYSSLQKYFAGLMKNPSDLYQELSKISDLELNKLKYTYLKRGDISKQPVVLLRNNILDKIIEKVKITDDLINSIKESINVSFPKDVFKVWKDPFRILYTFLYEKDKDELLSFFNEFIIRIQNELKIQDKTKFNLVHLDGAQNQGNDVIWFAIYNNSFKTQKFAKQLFFKIDYGFEYGLLDKQDSTINDLKKVSHLDFVDVITEFKKHINIILNDNALDMNEIEEYVNVLEFKKQIILQGPPGTGKTYLAKKMATSITGSELNEQNNIIQFHPSFTYEDFVRGISAKNKGEGIEYITENKILGKLALEANANPSKNYVLIIDEINRANLPSVLGELIYALEYRGKAVNTIYGVGNDFTITIPENLFIIGTMNTADRSVGHIDYAIKRRFAFVDILPKEEVIKTQKGKALFQLVAKLFIKEENGKISKSDFLASDFEYKDVQLGHSYFILKEDSLELQKNELQMRLKYEIIPILNEYVKDGLLNENAKIEIEKIANFDC